MSQERKDADGAKNRNLADRTGQDERKLAFGLADNKLISERDIAQKMWM